MKLLHDLRSKILICVLLLPKHISEESKVVFGPPGHLAQAAYGDFGVTVPILNSGALVPVGNSPDPILIFSGFSSSLKLEKQKIQKMPHVKEIGLLMATTGKNDATGGLKSATEFWPGNQKHTSHDRVAI